MNEKNLYTIKKGDTFWDLEREWGIPHGTLQKLNPTLEPRKLQIGHDIQIVMPTMVYLVAEKIPYKYDRPYFDNNLTNEARIDNLYVHSPYSSYKNDIKPFLPSTKSGNYGLQTAVQGLTVGRKVMSLENVRRTRLLTSNELWHFQKNGAVTHPWKKMKNGQSHWKNNIVRNHRRAFKTASKARAVAPSLLRKAGPVLLLADVALSGEIKPSHVVNIILVGASSTGVGAIFAGIYFVADIGTGIITGSSISERLDGWSEENLGRLQFYESYY